MPHPPHSLDNPIFHAALLQAWKRAPEWQVGWYVIRVRDPADAAQISETVDALFKNSSAETLTETEKSFQAGLEANSRVSL